MVCVLYVTFLIVCLSYHVKILYTESIMNIDFICIVSFHGVLVKESAFLRKCAVEKKKSMTIK